MGQDHRAMGEPGLCTVSTPGEDLLFHGQPQPGLRLWHGLLPERSTFPPQTRRQEGKNGQTELSARADLFVDRDGACVAAVEQGPDGFSMKFVSENGSSTIAWTPDDERIARKDLLSGKIKAFYKFNTSRALACCGQPKHDQRSDWDPVLELNLQLTIKCSKNASAVVCQ